MDSQREKHIEALLYYRAEPISKQELANILACSQEEVAQALDTLESTLQERGIRLMRKEHTVTLATAPEAHDLIEQVRREELSRDIGKAGLETLTIILYRAPIARAEIDYIRGVNSTFILRNLLVRGLIEREQNPQDQRTYVYRPTFDLLQYLGVSKVEDLPDFEATRTELENFIVERRGDEDTLEQDTQGHGHG